ncbi:hypothetical protein GH714_008018 [Hevea brasiliensis]|uniref:Aminotransferase-like plant mobile domain-containing protein n=1 Tax=Hevea brasiliensis TaxID=3981 RepID=A0A6A6N1E2_HEVBR|nr:hypothetical protein GH714_008018 [Hevea brasiliensis]
MAKPFLDTTSTIIEEREELIISPVGDCKPILRTAHFLKPIIASIDEPDLPSYSVSLQLPPAFAPSFKVSFGAWRHHHKDWNKWVSCMHSIHHSAWEKAGICEAILSSTYEIPRYDNLIFGLAEYWCPNTNTFIFPWAEATITLEDVMFLGDYPVLGSPVSCSVQKIEWKKIEGKLMDTQKVVRSKAKKVCQYAWMRNFIQCGTEIEHEAFLSLWLSRFVFQNSAQTIRKNVFPIAINLARGIPVALAPAVLASIYRDLSRLKGIIISSKFKTGVNNESMHIPSPFQLVQLWAWERFQALQPNPNMIIRGDPRFSRWNKVRFSKVDDVGLALASAGESFVWRPYAKLLHNWRFPRFYNEKEEWLSTDLGLDRDLESFACCLRVSKLVGIGFIENYFPHRVAMQFGIDQDIPGNVEQCDETSEVGWTNYSRPIVDSKFYVPSRLFQSGVTSRYLKWWKQLVLGQQESNKVSLQRSSIQKRKSRDSVEEDKPGTCGKRKRFSKTKFSNGIKLSSQFQSSSSSFTEDTEMQTSMQRLKTDQQAAKIKKKARVPDVPPGFHPKYNIVKMENSHDQTDEEMLTTCNNCKTFGKRAFDNSDMLFGQSQSSSASFTHDKTARKMDSMPKFVENILHSEVAVGSSQRGMEETSKSKQGNLVYNKVSLTGNEGEDSSDTLEISGLALEARIKRLEKEITKLKAARFGNRFPYR